MKLKIYFKNNWLEVNVNHNNVVSPFIKLKTKKNIYTIAFYSLIPTIFKVNRMSEYQAFSFNNYERLYRTGKLWDSFPYVEKIDATV